MMSKWNYDERKRVINTLESDRWDSVAFLRMIGSDALLQGWKQDTQMRGWINFDTGIKDIDWCTRSPSGWGTDGEGRDLVLSIAD